MEITMKFPDSCYKDDPIGYDRFFEAMQFELNRMAMSHAKYQQNAVPPTMEAATEFIDEIQTLIKRLAMYDDRFAAMACDCGHGKHLTGHATNCFLNLKPIGTGNTENLLDASNMCRIEFLFPKHPKAHFRAQSSKESPGLSYKE